MENGIESKRTKNNNKRHKRYKSLNDDELDGKKWEKDVNCWRKVNPITFWLMIEEMREIGQQQEKKTQNKME